MSKTGKRFVAMVIFGALIMTFTLSCEVTFADVKEIKKPVIVKIDINKATVKDLVKVKGIGEFMAKRILEQAPFKSWKDVDAVSGIGDVKLKRIKKLFNLK